MSIAVFIYTNTILQEKQKNDETINLKYRLQPVLCNKITQSMWLLRYDFVWEYSTEQNIMFHEASEFAQNKAAKWNSGNIFC